MQDIETKLGVSLFVRGDLALAVWRDPVTVENWAVYQRHVDRAVANNPTVLAVSVVFPRSSPPDARTRAMMRSYFERLGPKLRQFVIGVIGDDLFARVVRVFVRTTLMIVQRGKHSFFDDLAHARALIREHATDRTPQDSEIASALYIMFAQLQVEPRQS